MTKPRARSLLSTLVLLGAGLAAAGPADAHGGPTAEAGEEPQEARSFTFGAVGDHGSNADSRAVLRSAGAADLDLFMSLGDLSYDTIEPEPWCRLVKDELNAGAGRPAGDAYGETFPFALVQGNHEDATIDRYVASGCLPDRLGAETAADGDYGKQYYVDYPAEDPLARFVVASPGLGYSYAAGSPHRQWLVDALDSARAEDIPWIIVVEHFNYISTGTKADAVGKEFFDLLVSKRVDLVLQGHDHTYQRSKQLALGPSCPTVPRNTVEPACIVDDGADGSYAAGAGTVVLINGLGGAENYPIAPDDPEAGYFSVAQGGNAGEFYGFTEFTVTDSALSGTFVGTSATGFTDSFSIGGPPPEPVAHAESWSGPEGGSWPSVWSSSARSGVVDVSGGHGRLLVDDASGAFARSTLSGVAATRDTDLVTSFGWAGSAQSYLNVFVRGSGGWLNPYRPRNGYGVHVQSNSTRVVVQSVVNGTMRTVATVPNAHQVGTGRQWLRLRVVGDRLMFRTWPDGSAEPSGWAYSGTDASVAGSGQVFVTHVRASSTSGGSAVSLDDLTLTDLAAPPDDSPPSAPGGLVAQAASPSRVDLSWDAAADDEGVTGYEVVRNGTVLPGLVTATTFTDTTVEPDRTYVYEVRARDAAGNVSAHSVAVEVTTPRDPVVHVESWSGPEGGSWPSVWSPSARSGLVDVGGGRGRLVVDDASGAFARSSLSGVAAIRDTDLVTSFGWAGGSAQSYLNVFVRGSGGWLNPYRPRNGYGLHFRSNSTRVVVQSVVNGTMRTVAAVPNAHRVGTGRQWLRLRVVGDRAMFRTWPAGSQEPSGWAFSGTDASVAGSGQVFVTHVRASSTQGGAAVSLDDLVLTDLAAAP